MGSDLLRVFDEFLAHALIPCDAILDAALAASAEVRPQWPDPTPTP